MTSTIGTPPPLRRIAAVVVGVEALALAVIALWIGLSAVIGGEGTAMAVSVALMALAVGVPLGWASYALWRGAGWPRGLAITWQLLQAAAGVTVLEWSTTGGVAAIALAAAGAIVLFVDARRDASNATQDVTEPVGPPSA